MIERSHAVRAASAVLGALLVVVLAACGEREEPTSGSSPEPERVDVILDWIPNADHIGIYAAKAGGQFEQAALRVRLRTPATASSPLELLAAGKADLAISYEPELLLARAKGAKLVAVGALVQKPLTSLMAIGPHAIGAGELEGAKVGTAGLPYQEAYLKTIVDKAGIDPDRVHAIDVGFDLARQMLTKRVDATLGAFWNIEGVELKRRGKHPRILRMDKVGVPTYNELVVVAREEDVHTRGRMLRRFMQALARGTRSARDDPGPGIATLLKAEPDLRPGVVRAQVEATLPVLFPHDEAKPYGYQDPAAWNAYAEWMVDNDLLASPRGANRAFTNEFLPGEGI